jgi:hypothetical protein
MISFLFKQLIESEKSHPAAEPHGSSQGCTVRSRKGAGQSSMKEGESVIFENFDKEEEILKIY